MERANTDAVAVAKTKLLVLDIDATGVVYTGGQECARYDASSKRRILKEAWQRVSISWGTFERETSAV